MCVCVVDVVAGVDDTVAAGLVGDVAVVVVDVAGVVDSVVVLVYGL